MSHIKNYLEDISVELGYDGEINDHVRREGEVRLRSSEHQVGKGDKYEDDERVRIDQIMRGEGRLAFPIHRRHRPKK
jgi:hypothetical protein